jgi:RNA polymerase sigma-70 factor (ECF subfamily)
MATMTAACRVPSDSRDAITQDLYRQYRTGLLAQFACGTGDPYAAEDILQETMLRAWQHADEIDTRRGSVRGWLGRIGQNLVIDAHRARNARPPEVFKEANELPTISDHADGVATSMMVRQALGRLRPAHRQVLVEVYYCGLDTRTVADALGIPVGTVKSRLHYATLNLRRLLSGEAM